MTPEHTRSSASRRPRRGSPRRSNGSGRRPAQPQTSYTDRAETTADLTPILFDALPLTPSLHQGLRDLGFVETRPVQSAVLPFALAGDDVLVSAETGSGKTVAFVLPILQRLFGGTAAARTGTRALVLAPTRELAVQIADTIEGLTYHTSVTSAVVCGGLPMEPQDRALRAGVDIVVATPGRLMDHMRGGAVDFSGLDVLVLDEADRMMDMGFWPDVQRIVSALPAVRQTLLFSATLPDEVMSLSTAIVRPEARYLQLGRAGRPAATITHTVQTVPSGEKVAWLARFLRQAEGPTLVFVRRKTGAERLARDLQRHGLRAAALHGDRSQGERTAAVEGFRSGRFAVLVATDIAARGLDIDGITHVVNFEVPDSTEAYVHRVGRTGRDRATGTALTLAAPEELRALRALEKSVGVEFQ